MPAKSLNPYRQDAILKRHNGTHGSLAGLAGAAAPARPYCLYDLVARIEISIQRIVVFEQKIFCGHENKGILGWRAHQASSSLVCRGAGYPCVEGPWV